MTLTTTPMKAAAAAVTALALTFSLSACGEKQETASGGLSTAATAPGAATAEEAAGEATEAVENEASDAETTEENTAKDKDKKEPAASSSAKPKTTTKANNSGNNAGAAAVPTIANPFENGQVEVPTYEPIANGQAGSEADRKQMEDVVRKVTNPDSFATWTRTILDNSCAAVREPALEEFERQGLTLDMVEQMMRAQEAQGGTINIPKTDVKVTDVRIDGNRASATVSTSNSEGNASQVQLFAKEDGRWKVCNG
ncbi:hypothetical protein M5J20_00500 [Corynebacterium sp. TA-R-1]|uniref:Nuclear transport factor 2 family protein n=1 Tax=Corynebacterium stercoris TaxID=2943490 RepID=A0ABT1FY90_9CORY|nr:hypothetical protein [Corynebacterium stercoris]MCP1386681.1 hypothetical protein [Corynebacterium stercoris]